MNQITNNNGLSDDGGVVLQGSMACLPKSPTTFLIGTVGGVFIFEGSSFFSIWSWLLFVSPGDWNGIGGKTGKEAGDTTADKNLLDWDDDEEEDGMGGEAINLAAGRKRRKQNRLEKFLRGQW